MDHDHPGVSASAGFAVRGTVLLVDDDITYRQVIGEMLTEDGWDVIETSTGEDALTFSGNEGKPTLLVTDINLGGGTSRLCSRLVLSRPLPSRHARHPRPSPGHAGRNRPIPVIRAAI
jgi:CheY-like chemotaxis protein